MVTRREKLHAFLEREGATSLMNNTKWRNVLDALCPLHLNYRIKTLQPLADPDSYEWTWMSRSARHEAYVEFGTLGPIIFLEIEWLDIDPYERKKNPHWIYDSSKNIEYTDNDYTSAVEAILKLHKVPFSKDAHIIRIWAHLLKVSS